MFVWGLVLWAEGSRDGFWERCAVVLRDGGECVLLCAARLAVDAIGDGDEQVLPARLQLVMAGDGQGICGILLSMKCLAKCLTFTSFFYFLLWGATAQVAAVVAATDTTVPHVRQLGEVLLQGYGSAHRLIESPYATGYVRSEDLQRSPGTSLLPVLNTLPGVRMEERSPGSYRLSVRGSLLRSPYGVRNIKVYWDELPLTDAGGNTYINLLDLNALQGAEVLKGPAGSMYGANTGGALLLHSDSGVGNASPDRFRVQGRGGSYGMWGEDVQWQHAGGRVYSEVFQSHNQSDGYRDNTASRKEFVQWNGHMHVSAKDELHWMAFYTDLRYETPGGLTAQQLAKDPRQARPATATLPGAEEQRAAVYNKTFFVGLSHAYSIDDHWKNVTSLVVMATRFDNPFITNFEKRKELTMSGVTKWSYEQRLPGASLLRLVGGAEYQYTRSNIADYGNADGVPDTVQSVNKLQAFQFFPYVQGEWHFARRWLLQAGASVNSFRYRYLGYMPATVPQHIVFHWQVLPRAALQYSVVPGQLSMFASVAKGYSPPTIAEVFPAASSFYNQLQPEEGWNYEVGVKTNLLRNRLLVSLDVYAFRLNNAIVPRYDSAGNASFVNAGGTNQRGFEAAASWVVVDRVGGWLPYVRVLGSYSLQDYLFRNYKSGDQDYSGHRLTGVPRNVLVGGLDLKTVVGVYLNATYTYTGKLPVNDANTAVATDYHLLQGKVGYSFRLWKVVAEVYGGVDNAFNVSYSLGNDLNAVGNRYFNPAPPRNYFGGFGMHF